MGDEDGELQRKYRHCRFKAKNNHKRVLANLLNEESATMEAWTNLFKAMDR